MPTAESLPHVCLPVNLDAFVLNEKVCDASGLALIAPITQPNYVNLRLSNDQIQHDILQNIDLHNAQKGLTNPRISTTYQAPFRSVTAQDPAPDVRNVVSAASSRQGVYLHWTIPRAYRSATSQATPPPRTKGDTAPEKIDTNPNPVFPLVPNRWMVVRVLQPGWSPNTAKPDPVSAWVIESDHLQKLEDLDLDENGLPIDLETDVAPFVAYAGDAEKNGDILNNQAEKYIGIKTPLAKWREQKFKLDQKVDLTVMNSSNPLFADYAPHNANVFSMKDNFFYGIGNGGVPLYLESATCDYVVFGWHSDDMKDPLGQASSVDLKSRLNKLFCASPVPDVVDRDNSSGTTRLICHAAKYDVVYSPERPESNPAHDYAINFTKGVDMEPVAIGTSPLDSILAFFQAHSNDHLEEDILKAEGVKTAQSIMGIRELLYATEDDYDSRIKAADLVFAHNFDRSQGGSTWRFDKKKDPKGPPVEPSTVKPDSKSVEPDPISHLPDPLALKSEVELMKEINEYQRMLDVASAKLDQLRWALFAEWFKYLSDPSNEFDNRIDLYKTRVPLLRTEAGNLIETINTIQSTKIDPISELIDVKKVAQDPFFKRNDPTLCLAGIDAGWDAEYLENTPTRFADGLSNAGSETNRPSVSSIISMLDNDGVFSADGARSSKTGSLSSTLKKLMMEASKGHQQSLDSLGHKKWTGQPFAPQFIEWEGVYYHVDWTPENWDVQLTNSAVASSNHKQVMYVNPVNISKLPGPRKDQRSISGRMLVLPQPSFSLGAVVAQVLDSTPSTQLPPSLQSKSDRDALKKASRSLKFISGEMTGLTDALLTMAKGQHVKPSVRVQGSKTVAMKASVDVVSKIPMSTEDFEIISGETGRTPYGTLVNFDAPGASPAPFKAVQHGQFGELIPRRTMLAFTKVILFQLSPSL